MFVCLFFFLFVLLLLFCCYVLLCFLMFSIVVCVLFVCLFVLNRANKTVQRLLFPSLKSLHPNIVHTCDCNISSNCFCFFRNLTNFMKTYGFC